MSTWSNAVKLVKFFWENDQRPEFITYFGAHKHPKIEPLRPIFHTLLKVLTMCIWNITYVKPVTLFEKMAKDRYSRSILGPMNWASEALSVPIFESNSNEHIKQICCKSRGNFWTKKSKSEFRPIWSNMGLWGIENRRKHMYWPILALLWTKRGPKIWSTGTNFYTQLNYPQYACKWSFIIPY